MTFQIIDCTVRDGGHLNQWNFEPDCVRASYFAALSAGADIFEVGYRFPASKTGLGRFGYCEDAFLTALLTPQDACQIAVMINASAFTPELLAPRDARVTPVSVVRLAAYPYEIDAVKAMCRTVRDMGYRVFLNLMAFSEISESEFAVLEAWSDKGVVEAVYFADSFGAFTPKDVEACHAKLRRLGFDAVGFHSHNNLQTAFANTLKAIDVGCTHVDASVYGMGRGAGNLPIEVLIAYLEKMGVSTVNPVPYLDIIERFYKTLHAELQWGYSLETLTAGIKNVHPYYVDNIARRRTYTVSEMWNVLDRVKAACPISYSVQSLDQTLDNRLYRPLDKAEAARRFAEIENELTVIDESDAFRAGRPSFTDVHRDRTVLILASGPSIARYAPRIKDFAESNRCVTIGLNRIPEAYAPAYHLFVNKRRFLRHARQVNPRATLIVPSFFGRKLVAENCDNPVIFFDVEMTGDKGATPLKGDTQHLLHLSVSGSAVLIAYAMGAKEIFIAGMDGYVDTDQKELSFFYNEADVPEDRALSSIRYEKLREVFEQIERFLIVKSVPLSIITPTSHKELYRDKLNLHESRTML